MKDIELLEFVIESLSPAQREQFRKYLRKHHRVGALRGSIVSVARLAHESRDRSARKSRTWAKKGSAKYAGETPEQVYAKVYAAQVEKQLAYLQRLLLGAGKP